MSETPAGSWPLFMAPTGVHPEQNSQRRSKRLLHCSPPVRSPTNREQRSNNKFLRNSSLRPKVRSALLMLLAACYISGQVRGEPRAPRITIQPTDLVAIEGESAELNCDAEGEPEPSIEWYHNGQLIKTSTHSRTTMGGSIQFLDIRPAVQVAPRQSDTGVYYCLAKNSLGQARSRNATLQVAYIKAEFRLTPQDKLVAVGDSVAFDCLPEAWPEPNIRWRRNGQFIEVNDVSRESGSAKYAISRIAKTTAGRQQSDSNVPAAAAAAQLSDDNTGAKQLIDLFGSQLVIRQVDKNDEGAYSCLVETKGSHRLIERESPPAKLSAMVKPFFVEAPQHKSVEVGGQARLQCRMGGDPEPVVAWRKHNGQPLSEKLSIDPVDKSLIFNQVSVVDQGTYVCEGENPLGSARSMATISVNSRPKFIVQPEDQESDLGSKVKLRCAGEGSPQPMLYWYKEGHRQLMFAPNPTSTILGAAGSQLSKQQSAPIDWPQAAPLMANDFRLGAAHSDTSPAINPLFSMPINADQLVPSSYSNSYFGNRIYVDNQGSLNIENITSSDNGYYACALISSVGSTMAKAKLTVRQSNALQGPPEYFNSPQDPFNGRSGASIAGTSKFDLLPPPFIKLGAANQTLPTNTSAELVCEVVSQVAYKIQWFFESQPLQEEPPRVMVLETGALKIESLRISDSGIYTCVVTAVPDQGMSLASPFEPIDSSMLTSAPPIQQSTTHATKLKVASPMDPNIQFYRMSTYAYPSSPGPAYLVSTNGNDAITIAWAAPSESGALPIKEYSVEHYDTSQESLGWRTIYKIKGKESLLIDGLSAEGSHFFVIKATNGHGTGPSSAIAGPMRTVAGESRYQLEVQRRRVPADQRRLLLDQPLLANSREDINLARDKLMTISTTLLSVSPIGSTSVRLQWSTKITGNLSSSMDQLGGGYLSPSIGAPDVKEFLEGFSIRYRATGIGESLSKEPIIGSNWNAWQSKNTNAPSSLPLMTSYVDGESLSRRKRDLSNYFDYSQEFNEVRVVDHNTEHYTINVLNPFTVYQFFVVPYYKDIDGTPSNILTAQTNEDRPTIAPQTLTVQPINATTIRLLWLHVPPLYANGIIRSYTIRINRSDLNSVQQPESPKSQPIISEPPKILNLPLGVLNAAPTSIQGGTTSVQQYIVMHELTNLIYKSFYSIQVAATTSAGTGPWSNPQKFIMDPIMLQQKSSANVLDELSTGPQSYSNLISNSHRTLYLAGSLSFIVVSILAMAGYLLYRRNSQKVMTWKKTISEHFNNKSFMPSSIDHHEGPNSNQQNIYDHQQHLIYSRDPAHMIQPTGPQQTLWTGCVSSNGSGSVIYHGGLLPINNDLNSMNNRKLSNGEQQALLMGNQDTNTRFTGNNQPIIDSNPALIGSTNQNQIIQHSDYYSVINNTAEYEELDPHLRSNMQAVTNGDRVQTASSNSDTSCPSSVTRLIPNNNYNRDLLNKTYEDNNERHEMVLHQQLGCGERKQPFATMINGDASTRLQPIVSLSPYATTNLMKMPQQVFQNHQMNVADHSRQQNHFVIHNNNVSANMTMDDSAKALLNHQQQINGTHNPISVFRTLQRNPVNFQSRRQSSRRNK